MSDDLSYEVRGVVVTPLGGGFYQISHDSLAEPEKVRGKETADKRAKEVADLAAPAEGTMDPQGPLPDVVAPARDDAMARMEALVAKQAAMIDQLLARVPATVTTDGEGADDPGAAARRLVPAEFVGQIDDATRKTMSKLGVDYVTIILEEGNDIPPTGLFLSHNGRSFMIRPGEPVDVPDFLLGILDNAVMSSPQVDTKSLQVLGYRSRMKYPYRRV